MFRIVTLGWAQMLLRLQRHTKTGEPAPSFEFWWCRPAGRSDERRHRHDAAGQPDYRQARERLREKVTPTSRVDGPDTHRQTTLAELFDPGTRQLFVYHLRFAPQWDQGCPHVQPLARRPQRRRPPAQGDDQLRRDRQGRAAQAARLEPPAAAVQLRPSFNADLGAEHPEWGQKSRISVFTKDQDGTIQLFYWGAGTAARGQHRGIDLLSPVWHVLDLLPGGRGDWMPSEGH